MVREEGGSGLIKIDMTTGQWENIAPNFGADTGKCRAIRDFEREFDLAFDPGTLYVAYHAFWSRATAPIPLPPRAPI